MNRYLAVTFLACVAGATIAPGCQKKVDPMPGDQLVKEESFERTTKADNTDRNYADRDKGAVTPLDQGDSEVDRAITQKIRQAIVGVDGLSMNAKNVKIITNKNQVTLRGPVETDAERQRINAIASSIADVRRVDDQLEVKNP